MRLLVLLTATVLLGCGQTPTGRSQLALVPDSTMTEMGAQAFAEIKRGQALAGDSDARALVDCVAREIIAAARHVYPGADFPARWEVALFENPSPNAFALPGGHIGVHSGMLAVTDNPAQLAAIIGHEVGHLLADHGNERMTQQLGISVVLMLIGLFGDVDSQAVLQALGLGAQLGIALPFSRAHEREADLMGLKVMAAAGFPPEQSVALWRNMSARSDGQPIELLSTHPAHGSRIQALQANMAIAQQLFQQARPAACAP